MIIHALALTMQIASGAPSASLPEDSVDALVERVRDAQRGYERTAVRNAPTRMAFGGSDRCDEHVGRFCLYYEDSQDPPDEPEAEETVEARRALIEELRRAFSILPGDDRIAGPLIRYLVQDDRAGEAVSAARTFTLLSTDTTTALLFEGFALHAAARDSVAEIVFRRAFDRMDSAERGRFERIGMLLRGEERDTYEEMDEDARAEYERAFWTLADPLYLTPGNERRVGHYVRRMWTRLLAEAPWARGLHRWGDDLDELTLRYGIPVQRARILSRTTVLGGEHLVEWYDSARLAYAPRALHTEGVPPTPPVGGDWRLEDPTAPSQYAPVAFPHVVRLNHRVARFPTPDPVTVRLRFDAALPVDSTLTMIDSVRTGLFLLDDDHRTVRELRGAAAVRDDTAAWSVEVEVPVGRYVYSVEATADSGGFAGRARYAAPVPAYPRTGPALSDVLLRRPLDSAPGGAPTTTPDTLPAPAWDPSPNDTIGIYAEVLRLSAATPGATRYGVEILLRRHENDAALARAARWIGRRLGVVESRSPVRVRWDATGDPRRPAIVAFNLALDGVEPGSYTVVLTVTDLVNGRRAVSQERLRIREREE